MTCEPGTYALVLRSRKLASLRIGRLGTLKLQPGFYVYIGSAFGTGGLQARIKHHQRIAAHPHWHIDYLREVCDLVEDRAATLRTRMGQDRGSVAGR